MRTVRLGDVVLVVEHIRGFQVITHTARLPYSVPRHHVIAHVAGYGPITVDDCATKEAAAERLDMLERELGDTYAGSGGGGGDYLPGGLRENQPGFGGSSERAREGNAAHWRQKNAQRDAWPMDKSLCGIPTLYAWSLAYGRNLLRPERTTDPWRIRNLGTWLRPNPPVGALGDKVRPASSFITIATKARNRWFDLDAVRGDPADVKDQRVRTTNGPKNHADPSEVLTANYRQRVPSHPNGAPPLDWHSDLDPDGYLHLILATEPYTGSHYATFPRRLPEKFVQMMCPLRVCTVCGEPSRRIAETTNAIGEAVGRRSWRHDTEGKHSGEIARSISSAPTAERRTLGWTDCGCSTDGSHWRNGVVLDPFAGTGTTLAVATGHGRDAIGIDIDERNADLALERIGPLLLTVEHHRREGAA